jgi:hypothetical protein
MSEEDSNDGSEVELTNPDVVIKTAKAKGKNKLEDRERLNQAILPPKYDILNKDLTSQQTTKKFGMHCARFAENKCSAGSMCIFSHDLSTSPTFRKMGAGRPSTSMVYAGVMFDEVAGCYQASVETQGLYICVGYFPEAIEAARARDVGTIRAFGFERAREMLTLDVSNYGTIDVRELRSYDELLEADGVRLDDLPDDSVNKFGYSWPSIRSQLSRTSSLPRQAPQARSQKL